jgi:hypothetical protein
MERGFLLETQQWGKRNPAKERERTKYYGQREGDPKKFQIDR